MAIASLRRTVTRLQLQAGRATYRETPLVGQLRADPARLLAWAAMPPDPWQAELLRSRSTRTLMVCGRQMGKSTTAAALALKAALLVPNSLVLLLSPTLRQSGELFRSKVLTLYRALGCPVPPLRKPTQLQLELANGSRVVSLPESEEGIRGYSSVRLLIVDEASRVSDALYGAVRPMLAVSRGGLVCLSTPFGKRGFFHDEWTGRWAWKRVRVTADRCPRITAEFLEEERQALGARWFRQEYFCSFEDAVDSVFSHEAVLTAVCPAVPPLFPE
jgi:hypothetical protein